MTCTALVFQNTTFNVVDQNGHPWLRAAEIAQALGYEREDSVSRIYTRNEDEFTNQMSGTVKLTVSGNLQTEQRIFSLRGCHLLAMLSRTKIAKAFRAWVLDILDKETGPRHEPVPYVQNRNDILSKEQAGILRKLLTDAAEKLPKGQQAGLIITGWSKLKAHFKVGYRDIPQAEFSEAVSIVARHISTGEWVGPEPLPAPLLPNKSRVLMDIENGQIVKMTPINEAETLVSKDEFSKILGKVWWSCTDALAELELYRARLGVSIPERLTA